MALPKWSVILNRIDQLGQRVWTEWRANAVQAGPAQPGDIPMIGTGGVIDASLLPSIHPSPTPVIQLTTGENVNAFQVVSVHSDGLAYKADASNLSDASRVIGVATTSATTGSTIMIQQIGAMVNAGWSWTPGQTVFLGLNGTLVVSPNAGVFELPLGTTVSASELEIQIGTPIILA